MKYELLSGTNKGVLIDRTPILQDIRDTFEVSFLLPDDAGYIALFKGIDGIEYRKAIVCSACRIPKELLAKEQYSELLVCKIDGERIIQTWACEPLKITALLNLRQTQWQVSGGMTDADAYVRMVELERLYEQTLADFSKLKAITSQHRSETVELVVEFKQELYNQAEAQAALKKDNEHVAAAYNKSVEVINDLSKRVVDLEKNYDPTLIK